MRFRRRDFLWLIGFFAVGRLLTSLFRRRPQHQATSAPAPEVAPVFSRTYSATITRVDPQTHTIVFTWPKTLTGEPAEEVARVDRMASVRVDGAEVPLSAVQVGERATVIVRVEARVNREHVPLVTAIRQPP
jgi:hypothetical protein